MNLETDFSRWLAAFKQAVAMQWPGKRPPVIGELLGYADSGWYMAPELRGNVVSETWGMFQNIGDTPVGRACVALAYIFDASVNPQRVNLVDIDEPQSCSPMAELATAQRDPELDRAIRASVDAGTLQARHDAWRDLAIARGKVIDAMVADETAGAAAIACEAIVAKLRALGVAVE